MTKINFEGLTEEQKALKLARIVADLETARGGAFTEEDLPNEKNIGDKIKEVLGPSAPDDEKAALGALQERAINSLIDDKKLDLARIHSILYYQGYTDTHYSSGNPDASKAAIKNFLTAHKEFSQNFPVSDLQAKVEDTLWAERQHGKGPRYMDRDSGNLVGDSAKNAFGGPDGIKRVQALLYLRDGNHNYSARPVDGVWKMKDQQELLTFLDSVNQGRVKSGLPPLDPADMRRGNAKEFGDQLKNTLTSWQVGWEEANLSEAKLGKYGKRFDPPTTASGNESQDVRTKNIMQMQLCLRMLNQYPDGRMPTGKWTQVDKDALKKYTQSHTHWYGDDLPTNIDNITGKQFEDILKYAQNEVKEKTGVDPAIQADTLTPSAKDVKPEPTPPARTETKPAPGATPPAAEPPKEPKDDKKGTYISHDHSNEVSDADVARMQAQLHFTDGYNGPFTGNIADAKDALTAFAQKNKVDISKGLDDPETKKRLLDEVQKRFDDWAKNKDNAAKLKDVMDKGWDVGYGMPPDDSVREMQKAVLAMGGSLQKWGVDGVRGAETTGAIEGLKGPDGTYKKILDAAGISQPAPANTPPANTPAAGTKREIENVWDDPVDDPFGGGFIKPLTVSTPAAAAQVDQTQTATPGAARPQDAFSRVAGGKGQVAGDPAVTAQPPPGQPTLSQTPDGHGLPPRGVYSSYFNANSQSNRGSATTYFAALTAPYVYDSAKRPDPPPGQPPERTELIPVPLGGKHGNQGALFVIGPDRHFATMYNVNGNFDPSTGQYFDPATHTTFDPKYGNADPEHRGMPVTTYAKKVYDLYNDKERDEFNSEIEKAFGRQRDVTNSLGPNPAVVMAPAIPPQVVRAAFTGIPPWAPMGPSVYEPGGVHVGVRIGRP